MKELILPFPPRVLNPNSRVHWSVRANAAKAYKRDCWMLAKAAGWFGVKFASERVHLWIDFYPPDRRHRDDDNAASSFKAARDGIADSLGINDKRFVSHPMLHAFRKDFQGVKVRVTESVPNETRER